MSIRMTEQVSLWDQHRSIREKVVDVGNKFGPFKRDEAAEDADLADDLERKFDCSNYDKCLSFASRHLWGSFTCGGCRKGSPEDMKLTKVAGEYY